MKESGQKIDLRAILEEYRPSGNALFGKEGDERVDRIKQIIYKDLSEADRIIFLVYTETQSYRALGKLIGVSHTTAGAEVKRIRNLIINKLKR